MIRSRISPWLTVNETLSAADLSGSRLCNAGMTVLAHMSESGSVGLTGSGAFNRKFVVWAVDQFQWPGYTALELAVANRVLNEEDVFPLLVLHALLRGAKLIRRTGNKAVLTKDGNALVGDAGRLQVVLFETFFTRFDFAAFDRRPVEISGADTVHFLGVVKNRLTTWVDYPTFASWCLPLAALPQEGLRQMAMFYLETRVVRPLAWLGLIEQADPSYLAPLETVRLRKTPLFDQFMQFDVPAFGSIVVH
jgi:hypothetical protein